MPIHLLIFTLLKHVKTRTLLLFHSFRNICFLDHDWELLILLISDIFNRQLLINLMTGHLSSFFRHSKVQLLWIDFFRHAQSFTLNLAFIHKLFTANLVSFSMTFDQTFNQVGFQHLQKFEVVVVCNKNLRSQLGDLSDKVLCDLIYRALVTRLNEFLQARRDIICNLSWI